MQLNNNIAMLNNLKDYSKMEDQIISTSLAESPIQTFYKDKGVFLTGGTGFFGKIIIEKLLRITEVNQIYLLIRPKKGKDAYTRIDELFNDAVFDKLKKCNPTYREKITIISGDCSLPALGISESEREAIKDNVNIVIHGAATVRFDEKLKIAIAINVNGTKEMLKLAKEIVHLKAFVHVSTAFANCNHKHIEEKLYTTSITGENACKLTDCLDEQTMDLLTPHITKDYPNTYTYTKCLAENIIKNNGASLPVVIYRPGIVITTYKEPIPGWIDNMYGPCGIVIGIGSGVLRIMKANLKAKAHLVPVDLCVNALLTSAWDIARNTYETPPIYNYVPDNDNSVSWGEYMHFGLSNACHYPLIKSLWLPTFTVVSTAWEFFILSFFYHTVPAFFIDVFMVLSGRKRRMLKIYKKIHKFIDVMQYFAENEFTFDNNNVRTLAGKLTGSDRELFAFDMRDLNWNELFGYSLNGLRTYVAKDDPSTLPAAKKRFQRLHVLHNALLFVVYTLLMLVLYIIIKLIFL